MQRNPRPLAWIDNLCLLLFGLLLCTSTHAQESTTAKPFTITPSRHIDERLFLLRVLETMYNSWPTDVTSGADFRAATVDLRQQAIKYRVHAANVLHDDELARLFADFIDTLDAYKTFFDTLDSIDRHDGQQGTQDNIEAGTQGALSGAATYSALKGADYSTGDAAGAAIVVGAIQAAISAWYASTDRDAAKQRLADEASQLLSDSTTEVLQRAQSTSQKMSRQYSWGRRDAGFELSTSLAAEVDRHLAQADWQALFRILDGQVAARPKDPFIRLSRNLAACLIGEVSSERYLTLARDSRDAASLVPQPAIYDQFRRQSVFVAAAIADRGREEEIQLGTMANTELGLLATQMWRTVLELEPVDPDGSVREALAMALLRSGHTEEAIEVGDPLVDLRTPYADSCYNFARLMNQSGNSKEALLYFQGAVVRGYCDIIFAQRDPYLTLVREKHAAEWKEWTSLQWEWRFVKGFLNDDIIITNNSRFTITNVELTARLENGTNTWEPKLVVNAIAPGESYKWVNCVKTSGQLTKAVATLNCEQWQKETPVIRNENEESDAARNQRLSQKVRSDLEMKRREEARGREGSNPGRPVGPTQREVAGSSQQQVSHSANPVGRTRREVAGSSQQLGSGVAATSTRESATSSRLSLDELIGQGYDELANGRNQVAVELFTAALRREPSGAALRRALIGRSAAYAELNQMENARKDNEALLEVEESE